ncbi:universal stress protein [Nonomuraea gerenzanensis]|uniref:Universal stress protein family n=1 Tax=Nonomuraea gerenzanensis TaxID=93944 RepID=A0A1M4EMG3_9ACTN|nr:universal stress protein [Nonomuraea gerenzanensis]UBU11519.1 universal stress protein [Nonomuraea gerenzanensis]SBP00008.1 Universal stress protein family [Nonomuraea gerenzanensis]
MILVGVDGSRAGLEAAGWAAREAALRDVPLLVAHAMPRWAYETETGRLAEVAAWMREGGRSVLTAAEERARGDKPKISLRTTFLPDDPRAALIEAARDAELLVVGSHGLGGVRGMLVGSVAYGVAGHAPCDVVVVRQVSSAGEIVAGVDGSAASPRVLEFGFAEAALRGARLRVVHARAQQGFEPAAGEGPGTLKETLSGLRVRFPGVAVVEELVHGHPVEVLRQAAAGAELLVVGSHGQGMFAGMVLGSVSHALLHHAPCPLAVVRIER